MFFHRTDVPVSFAGEGAYRLDVDAASVWGVSAPDARADVWIVHTLCSHLWGGGGWFLQSWVPSGPIVPLWWQLVGCPHWAAGMAGVRGAGGCGEFAPNSSRVRCEWLQMVLPLRLCWWVIFFCFAFLLKWGRNTRSLPGWWESVWPCEAGVLIRQTQNQTQNSRKSATE